MSENSGSEHDDDPQRPLSTHELSVLRKILREHENAEWLRQKLRSAGAWSAWIIGILTFLAVVRGALRDAVAYLLKP